MTRNLEGKKAGKQGRFSVKVCLASDSMNGTGDRGTLPDRHLTRSR